MHSSSIRQLNSFYLQEYYTDGYLTKLKNFLTLFCCLLLLLTDISGVCKFLHLALLVVSFVVINFFLCFLLVQYVYMFSVRIEKNPLRIEMKELNFVKLQPETVLKTPLNEQFNDELLKTSQMAAHIILKDEKYMHTEDNRVICYY